jgi:two-component system phosphate regulon response regulator OmpR
VAEERPHILVVDDDDRIRHLLAKFLSEHGFLVSVARDANETRAFMTDFVADLLIVDVMMPGETGIELTQVIRQASQVPIIMLTAMGTTEERIAGLTIGADDYVTKPFDPRELVLRIRNILQRTAATQDSAEPYPYFCWGEFHFHVAQKQLWRQQQPINLTALEIELLCLMLSHVGEIVAREYIAEHTGVHTRSVDVQMTRLRQKIEDDASHPRFLQTVRGKGYRMHAEPKPLGEQP